MNNRLKELRKELKLTQTAFGEALMLSQNYIAMLETGQRPLSARTISDICRVYHVSEEWLRTGEGEMFCAGAEEDALYEWMERVLSGGDPFRKKFLRMLSRLRPEHWGALEEMMRLLLEEQDARGGETTDEG